MNRFFGEFAATRFSNDDIRKRHRNSSLRWRSSRSRLRNMTIFPKEIVPKPRSDGCTPSAQTCRNHTGRVPCEVGHLTCRQILLKIKPQHITRLSRNGFHSPPKYGREPRSTQLHSKSHIRKLKPQQQDQCTQHLPHQWFQAE